MGAVFVADNLVIGRKVAVKLLKAELLADAMFRKRFQQEATAVAAIEHRNVARFFDLVVGDPTFLVMEHVAGPALSKVLRREVRLDPVRAINIAVRLAWALDSAHAVGIIHRDIKPANVVLAPDPELGEEPKLIDFGLAKVPTIVGAETLTRTGQIVGTPAYMSPEQIANRDVDARSDVYALGCLLYHMSPADRPSPAGTTCRSCISRSSACPIRCRCTPRTRRPSSPPSSGARSRRSPRIAISRCASSSTPCARSSGGAAPTSWPPRATRPGTSARRGAPAAAGWEWPPAASSSRSSADSSSARATAPQRRAAARCSSRRGRTTPSSRSTASACPRRRRRWCAALPPAGTACASPPPGEPPSSRSSPSIGPRASSSTSRCPPPATPSKCRACPTAPPSSSTERRSPARRR